MIFIFPKWIFSPLIFPIADANFLTREANEWYKEPASTPTSESFISESV